LLKRKHFREARNNLLNERRFGAGYRFPGQNESIASPDLSPIVTQVAAKPRFRGGATPGSLMSGHLRFYFGAFVILAGFSTSPASSNPFADWFNVTPKQPAAPTSAEAEECLSRPGKSTAAGQRWVYRLESRRKCWFQTAEETAVKRQARRRAEKPRVAVSEENEAGRRERSTVGDARAELLRAAPAETSRPERPAPEFKMADAASVLATAIAAFVPPAPLENLATAQPTPDRRTPRQVDVETLLAAAPAISGSVAASVPPAALVGAPLAEAADDWRNWTATWFGALLMALGLISILGSSRMVREAVLLRG
jgi:hypothetical protein